MSRLSPGADLASPELNLSYDLKNSPFFKQNNHNYINVLSEVQLPSLKNVSLLDIVLSEGHIVEPHWHPNAAELVYAIQGAADVSVLNPFSRQVLNYRITPGQVVNVPKGWWHWEVAAAEPTHLLAVFDAPVPEVIFGSDILRQTPKEILQLSYCVNGEQLEQALQPITGTVVIGPPAGCAQTQASAQQDSVPTTHYPASPYNQQPYPMFQPYHAYRQKYY